MFRLHFFPFLKVKSKKYQQLQTMNFNRISISRVSSFLPTIYLNQIYIRLSSDQNEWDFVGKADMILQASMPLILKIPLYMQLNQKAVNCGDYVFFEKRQAIDKLTLNQRVTGSNPIMLHIGLWISWKLSPISRMFFNCYQLPV